VVVVVEDVVVVVVDKTISVEFKQLPKENYSNSCSKVRD
jgi:hypothetical protein